MANPTLALAGASLGALGYAVACAIAITGSALATPVLLATVPLGAGLAIAGGRRG